MPAGNGTAAANRAAAESAASALLARTPLPQGATEVTSDPSANHILAKAGGGPATTQLVDAGRFWRVGGDPATIFAWITAHTPHGSQKAGTGSYSGPNGSDQSVTFSFPTAAGIEQEDLQVSVAAAQGGGSAIRADGQAVWLVPRPASEVIPAGTTKVEVYVDHASTQKGSLTGTITSPSDVHKLVETIDALPIEQPGTFIGCPFIGAFTPAIDLRFIGAGATTLARTVEDNCTGLTFYIDGRRQTDGLQESVNLTTLLWGMHAFPVCTASQLAPSLTHAAATGIEQSFTATFALENSSGTLCGIDAWARLTMLDAQGRPIPTHVTYARPIGAPALLFGGVRVSYALSWSSAAPACPDQPPAPEISAVIPGIGRFRARTSHPIAPCGGRLTESAPG